MPQLDLALSERDAQGRWLTSFPGVIVQVDDRARHEVVFAGPLDVDPGAGGCAYEHRSATGYQCPLGDWRRVHVLSRHAGGEIRSYELSAEGTLLLAYPCYSGLWPEMDAEVQAIARRAR